MSNSIEGEEREEDNSYVSVMGNSILCLIIPISYCTPKVSNIPYKAKCQLYSSNSFTSLNKSALYS